MRRALAPRALAARPVAAARRCSSWSSSPGSACCALIGPFGFGDGFNKVAGSNTYGPVSPVEALGVWPASNYRLDAAGGAHLSGLAGAIGVLALLLGAAWWLRRRELAVPIALAACVLLYLVSLPISGDYSQAKALMIGAPLAMLIAIRPLLSELGRRPTLAGPLRRPAWAGRRWRSSSSAAPLYSTFLALRDAPVGPPGHGSELSAFLPIVRGKPVLYAGQDRYAAYELLGADTHVPLVEFPDEAVAAEPRRSPSTPATPTARSTSTPSRGRPSTRFPYVITGRAAWNSEAPTGFKEIAATPSYCSGNGRHDPRTIATCCSRGPSRRAFADCASPEIRDPHLEPGPRLALPRRGDRAESGTGCPSSTARHRRRARPRRSTLPRRALAALAPVLLPLRPDP